MRHRLPCSFLCLLLLLGSASAVHAAPSRVLMVVSGEGRDAGQTRPGFEMDEFAQAYLIFRDNGLEIDVASPRGGPVEADRYKATDAFNAALLADGDAVAKLAATRATSAVHASDYDAVFVVGGKGAMFDLPRDTALQALLAGIHDQGGIVAAVCHGPAALVDVRLPDGTLLVAGRAITGFSNEEEALFGKRWAASFDFLLEDAMRARGADWREAPLMLPRLVVDDRLVTGQNPYSTPATAEAVVHALGRVPVARTPWRDELTMSLVERLLAGDAAGATAALAANPERFHVELIGILGYYQLQAAGNDAAIRDALAIMHLAQPYMAAAELRLGIADALWRLGDRPRARAALLPLLETHPDMAEARQLLARIDR